MILVSGWVILKFSLYAYMCIMHASCTLKKQKQSLSLKAGDQDFLVLFHICSSVLLV